MVEWGEVGCGGIDSDWPRAALVISYTTYDSFSEFSFHSSVRIHYDGILNND